MMNANNENKINYLQSPFAKATMTISEGKDLKIEGKKLTLNLIPSGDESYVIQNTAYGLKCKTKLSFRLPFTEYYSQGNERFRDVAQVNASQFFRGVVIFLIMCALIIPGIWYIVAYMFRVRVVDTITGSPIVDLPFYQMGIAQRIAKAINDRE